MSRSGMRQLLSVVVFVVVATSLLMFASLFLRAGHYSITNIGARWIAFVAVLAAESAVIIWFSRHLNKNDPEYRRWFVYGAMLAVATMGIIVVVLAMEHVNGALDHTARPITVRIQSQGSVAGFESLTVDDWSNPSQTRTIFWRHRSDSASVRSVKCLSAITGDGLFGLSWISDSTVNACPNS